MKILKNLINWFRTIKRRKSRRQRRLEDLASGNHKVYYGCPNSKRVIKLNLKKEQKKL